MIVTFGNGGAASAFLSLNGENSNPSLAAALWLRDHNLLALALDLIRDRKLGRLPIVRRLRDETNQRPSPAHGQTEAEDQANQDENRSWSHVSAVTSVGWRSRTPPVCRCRCS